jgi:hypothetical protein
MVSEPPFTSRHQKDAARKQEVDCEQPLLSPTSYSNHIYIITQILALGTRSIVGVYGNYPLVFKHGWKIPELNVGSNSRVI